MLTRPTAFALYGLSALLATSAFAQPIPPASLPQQIDPGRQQPRFQQDLRPKVTGAPVVEAPAAPQAPIATGVNGSFVLRDVVVTGATAIPQAELEAIARKDIGKSVDLNGLRGVANRITAYYRNQGYILSRAIIPAGQNVSGGRVTIQVIEGYVDSVVFAGADEQKKSLLESYAERIKASKPLNNQVLERYLLLIDDITGATARGTLSPSPNSPGASQLTVTMDYKAIDGNVSIDNRGSNFLGQVQYSGLAGYNSLLGQSERIQVRGIASGDLNELGYIEGSYQQPFGPEGTTARVLGSYTKTNPGGDLKPLDIEGDSAAFAFDLRHPFVRSRKQNLFGTAGLRYRDSDTDVLSQRLYDDHIRSVNIGGSYDVLDGWQGINRFDIEYAHGLDVLGANDENDLKSRSNAETDFDRVTGQASRVQPLDRFYSLFVGVSGQYAFDPLFASEEFAVGGPAFGSAFDPAEITGDSGYAARAEYRYANTIPDINVDVYQIYAFYDYGQVFNRDSLIGEESVESLADIGLGTRFTFLESFAANLEVAFPIVNEVAAEGGKDHGARGFFSLSYLF